MMNWCEGLTLRAGGAARSDWKMNADNINMKIVRHKVLISGRWIIIEDEKAGE
jgi:hypothetical protein